MQPTPRIGLGVAILATGLGAQQPATPRRTAQTVAGGQVTISYHPMPLPARSLERHQRKGTVWSISDQQAAILDTEVALAAGKVLIPPGEYRLSTWFRDRGQWQLLVFQGPENFKSGTPYRAVPLRIQELDQARSELLEIGLHTDRGGLRLDVLAGTSRLRTFLEPLRVLRHQGTLAGRPATYEFYEYRAESRLQNRLRNLELVTFGRVRTAGAFGAVYDISCKSDGNGLFVICHSDTLRRNRELLATAGKTMPPAQQAELRAAIERQAGLQGNVMVAGEVNKVKERAGKLGVAPVLDSDGTAFELSFGIRKAKFTLNEAQFRKLQWRESR